MFNMDWNTSSNFINYSNSECNWIDLVIQLRNRHKNLKVNQEI